MLVKESPGRGRGVFAQRDFEQGELIETAPVIVLPNEDRQVLRLTILARYAFKWPRVQGAAALPLGYAMLHNHAADPNARWENDPDDNLMHFFATRSIAKGEEIRTNYGRPGYWKDTVDPVPWWEPLTARLRNGFSPKSFAVLLAAGAAIVGIARRRSRRARRSLAYTADDSPVSSALRSQSRRRASTS